MNVFNNKKVNFKKLESFGFVFDGENYVYSRDFLYKEFTFIMKVSKKGDIKTEVIENALNEPYTLHLVAGVQGDFVGKVKSKYEQILTNVVEKCFDTDIFKSETTKKVIEYVREKYGDELEYLWEKFPDNAVFRRKDNSKWYAAILTVTKNKLGLESNESVEIIDLRMVPEDIEITVNHKTIFPGWHMNKKHWISIILDGSFPLKEIYRFVDLSYKLANPNPK